MRKKIRLERWSSFSAALWAITVFGALYCWIWWSLQKRFGSYNRGEFSTDKSWGIGIDDVFTATIFVLPIASVSWVVYLLLRWKRVVDDGVHCIMCNYDLTGNESGICPECGSSVDV